VKIHRIKTFPYILIRTEKEERLAENIRKYERTLTNLRGGCCPPPEPFKKRPGTLFPEIGSPPPSENPS